MVFLPESGVYASRGWQGSRYRYLQFLGGGLVFFACKWHLWRYTSAGGNESNLAWREAISPDRRDKFRWVQMTRDKLMFKGLCRGHSWEVLEAFWSQIQSCICSLLESKPP